MTIPSVFKALNSAILCLVTSFLPNLVVGQVQESPKENPFSAKAYEKFTWGFRAGLNMTTQHFEDPDARASLDASPSLGYTLGMVAQFKLSDKYSLQTEAGYTQKSTYFKYNSGFNENSMSLQFIDLSLLLRRKIPFEWGKNIQSDFYFGAGPNINYWLGGSGSLNGVDGGTALEYSLAMDQTSDNSYYTLFLNGVNRWLFGIDIGVGVSAPISQKQKIFVEFRASLGQTNLGGDNSTATINFIGFEGSDFQKNLLKSNLKTFSLTAAYTFSFNYMESKTGRSTKDKMVKKKKPAKRRR